MIASGVSAGISKRELMEDYALDELTLVLDAYSDMHRASGQTAAEFVGAEDF